MTLISYLTQKQQLQSCRSAPPPYSHKGFDKLSFKKKAFTLAEVLITLTIIGVVAAMTIPTLMSKYQKHTYVVGLKKAYSQLSTAMKMIPLTAGCSAGDYACAGMTDDDKPNLAIWANQFKTQKICYRGDTSKDCEWHKIEGYMHEIGARYGGFITQDGMRIAMITGATSGASTGVELISSTIGVDINGAKGPNKMGRDIFTFGAFYQPFNDIPAGVVIPIGSKLDVTHWSGHSFYWKDNNYCTSEQVNQQNWGDTRLHACAGRVLEEDAMNY